MNPVTKLYQFVLNDGLKGSLDEVLAANGYAKQLLVECGKWVDDQVSAALHTLTTREIALLDLGTGHGRVQAVKSVRERTGQSVVEALKQVQEFAVRTERAVRGDGGHVNWFSYRLTDDIPGVSPGTNSYVVLERSTPHAKEYWDYERVEWAKTPRLLTDTPENRQRLLATSGVTLTEA